MSAASTSSVPQSRRRRDRKAVRSYRRNDCAPLKSRLVQMQMMWTTAIRGERKTEATRVVVVFVSSSFRNCTATSAHGFVEILRPVEPLGFAEPRHVAQYPAAEIRPGKVRAGP